MYDYGVGLKSLNKVFYVEMAFILSNRIGHYWLTLGGGSVRVFGYQYVGIDNAKNALITLTRTPNARGFGWQWNIGLMFYLYSIST